MSEVCSDNRFELIGEFKDKLVKGTNIETSPEEMAVLDNILFRIWQMGWLDKLKALKPRVLTLDEVSNATAGSLVWVESIYYSELRPAIVNHASNSKSGVVSMTLCDIMEGVGDLANYGKSWRCWTSEPSSEQRKEVG